MNKEEFINLIRDKGFELITEPYPVIISDKVSDFDKLLKQIQRNMWMEEEKWQE